MMQSFVGMLLLQLASLSCLIITVKADASTTPPPPPIAERTAVESVFELLREGNEVIRLDPDYKDIVILIGNAGAGKSTLGLILTTNNDELEAYDDVDSDRILIRDARGKIGTNAVKSKTIFPELMINPTTNVAFYDCPGFRDTRRRNASIEFVNTLFLKKITDHARSVKVVMVVNYSSVRKGETREDFLNLFQSTLGLIKSVEKFKNSISMVATKVDGVRSPKRTVAVIVSFLRAFEETMADVLKSESDIPRGRELINALTVTENGTYPRIYFTRIPSMEGKLSQIPEMQEDRAEIAKMVYTAIEYAPVVPSDFGYTFSPEALHFIRALSVKIDTDTGSHVSTVAEKVQNHFGAKAAQVTELRPFTAEVSKLRAGVRNLTDRTTNEGSTITAVQLFRTVLDMASNIQGYKLDDSSNKVLRTVEEQDKVFQLLQRFPDSRPSSDRYKWVRPLLGLAEYLQGLQNWYEFLAEIDDKQLHYNVRSLTTHKPDELPPKVSYVNGKNWEQQLQKLSEFFKVPTPHKFAGTAASIGEAPTLRLVDRILHRTIQLRAHEVKSAVDLLSVKIIEYYQQKSDNLEPSAFLGEVKKAEDNVGRLVKTCSNAPQEVPGSLAQRLNQTFSAVAPDLSATSQAVESIEAQGEVLKQLEVTSPALGKVDACASLQRLQPSLTFAVATIGGFSYIDNLAKKLATVKFPPISGSVETSAPPGPQPVYITSQNSVSFLQAIAPVVELPPAQNLDTLAKQRAFLNHLNQVFLAAQAQRVTAVTSIMNSLKVKIAELYDQKLVQSADITGLVGQLEQGKTDLGKVASSNSPLTPQELATTMESTVAKLGLQSPDIQGGIQALKDHDIILRTFTTVAPQLSRVAPDSSARILQPLVNHLGTMFDWYTFLIALDDKLTSIDVQRNIPIYNLQNIGDWGAAGKPQGIQITPANCPAFLNAASKTFTWPFARSVESLCATASSGFNGKLPVVAGKPEARLLRHLNDVLTRTLKTRPSCTVDGPAATISGPYIKFSEALACRQTHGKARLVILATAKFYLDADVVSRSLPGGITLDLIIFAPEWINLAGTINLSGHDGGHWPGPNHGSGENGNSGQPGGNGGNFVGVGGKFAGSRLTVLTDGGRGGPGQQGANGRNGNDGAMCDASCLTGKSEGHQCRFSITSRYRHELIRDENCGNRCSRTVYRLHGTPGEAGGRGGNGGKAGIGGNAGLNSMLIIGAGKDHLSQARNRGPDGPDGAGGAGGIGGQQNYVEIQLVDQQHEKKKRRLFRKKTTTWCTHAQDVLGAPVTRVASGGSGTPGANTAGLRSPPPQSFKKDQTLSYFNNFRAGVQQVSTDPIVRAKLVPFVNALAQVENFLRSPSRK